MPPESFQQQLLARFTAATRTDFSLFIRRVVAHVAPHAHFQAGWHIDYIAEHLRAVERGEIRRLLINLPPRMLKSTLISVAWPAWLLGHDQTRRILAASYAQSLATRHSLDCRAVIASAWYRDVFPATQLSAEQNEKERFATTARGHRLALSVGGAALGEGGNFLIADDPLSPLQARSRLARRAASDWFSHTFVTRLDDKARGAIVVVMQRLHVDDLSAHLLAQGGWTHLCLPAIAPRHEIYEFGRVRHVRDAGEALHPAREDVALLSRLQRELGSANFAAQYQQAPLNESGGLIRVDWLQRHRAESALCGEIVQSWDTAIKAGAGHDASACATFLLDADGTHRLIDMLTVRAEYPALKRLILSHAERFGATAVLIEDKASGQSLLQDLRSVPDLPLISIEPQGDKLTRLSRITPWLEAGKCTLPDHAPWLAAFEAELLGFPEAAHDDQVDAFSQYFNWRRNRESAASPNLRRV